jgi:uncharacterized repeat protein (TIGR03837 family)
LTNSTKTWDIFCRIIDNFGDIGICWRLAKQLSHEHHQTVRLWVDDLEVAQRIIPTLKPWLQKQIIEQVTIQQWSSDFETHSYLTTSIADVVIETFACELPSSYVAAMIARKPIWLNLEYLSAEPWVNEFHAKSSPHPRNGLIKHFFFPGFNEATGGLIREKSLIFERDLFQQSSITQAQFWESIGVKPMLNKLNVSLFCYPHTAIESLLNGMSQSENPVLCLAPETSSLTKIAAYFGKNELRIGETYYKGKLCLQVIPFLNQQQYDKLLWACDLNFVRGEDSWIRAVWANKPFVWQPYLQTEGTHMVKLEAFLNVYTKHFNTIGKQILRDVSLAWANSEMSKEYWQALSNQLPAIQSNFAKQSKALENQTDLATNLVIFCENLLSK